MDKQEIKILTDLMIQQATNDAQEFIETDAEIQLSGKILRDQAIVFLQAIPAPLLENTSAIDRKIKQLQRSLQKDNNEKNIIDAVIEIRQSILDESSMKKYTQAKLLFQKQLNAFLGQKVITKYVYSNMKNQEVTLVEIDSNLALEFERRRGTMRYTNMEYINKMKILQQSELSPERRADEQAAAPLKATYFEILRRGRKVKRKLKAAREKGAFIVFWEHMGKWQTMRVSSEGDINEAYANFYLNKKFFYFSKQIERDINTYMLDKSHGVVSVDAVSGLLQGDVNINNIAYAIKSRGASAFGDTDIISTAIVLANMPVEQITKEALEKIKNSFKPDNPEQFKSRQKLNEELSKESMSVINSIISRMQNAQKFK